MRDLKLYWNSIAETKEFTTPMRSDLFARHVKRNAEILDLGCGYGRIMHELSELELISRKDSSGAADACIRT